MLDATAFDPRPMIIDSFAGGAGPHRADRSMDENFGSAEHRRSIQRTNVAALVWNDAEINGNPPPFICAKAVNPARPEPRVDDQVRVEHISRRPRPVSDRRLKFEFVVAVADLQFAVVLHGHDARTPSPTATLTPRAESEKKMLERGPLTSPVLRVLIACETSGVMRRAFAALGHDVTSCDLLPAEDGSNHHRQCDVRDGILEEGWDLLAVMHPPCTRLCRSGRRWMSGPGKWTEPKQLPKGRTLAEMRAEFETGVEIFTACWRAPIERVAIENPEMNDLARERMPADLPAPQMVQPFWFGEPAYKNTGFYLRGLPALAPTEMLREPERGSDEWRAWSAIHRAPPGPDRWKIRSRTFEGLAAAAAVQWGGHALEAVAA